MSESIEMPIDIPIDPDGKAVAGSEKVEESLLKVDRRAKSVAGTMRSVFAQMEQDAKRAAAAATAAFDAFGSEALGALNAVRSSSNVTWDQFRKGAEKIGSERHFDNIVADMKQLGTNAKQGGAAVGDLGEKLSQSGALGDEWLKKLLRGQLDFNAATIVGAASFATFASIGMTAFGALKEKITEGYNELWKIAKPGGLLDSLQKGHEITFNEETSPLVKQIAELKKRLEEAKNGTSAGSDVWDALKTGGVSGQLSTHQMQVDADEKRIGGLRMQIGLLKKQIEEMRFVANKPIFEQALEDAERLDLAGAGTMRIKLAEIELLEVKARMKTAVENGAATWDDYAEAVAEADANLRALRANGGVVIEVVKIEQMTVEEARKAWSAYVAQTDKASARTQAHIADRERLNEIVKAGVISQKDADAQLAKLDEQRRKADAPKGGKTEAEKLKELWQQYDNMKRSIDGVYDAQVKMNEAQELLIKLEHAGVKITEEMELTYIALAASLRDQLHPELDKMTAELEAERDAVGKLFDQIDDRAMKRRDERAKKLSARQKFIADEQAAHEQSAQIDKEFQDFLKRTTVGGGLEAGFEAIKTDITDIGTLVSTNMVQAWQLAETAMLDFFETGEFKAEDFARQMTRLALQIGLRGFLGSFQTGGSFDVARFQTGGQFMVGGRGGIDQTPVAFMATPGERVIVQTPQQQRRADGGGGPGGGITILNHYNAAEHAMAAMAALGSGGGRQIIRNEVNGMIPHIARALRSRR